MAWFGAEKMFVLRAHLQVQRFPQTESQPLGCEDSKDSATEETQGSLPPWKAHHSFSERNWLWARGIGMQRERGRWLCLQRPLGHPEPACSPRPACPGGRSSCGSRWEAALAEASTEGARDCPVSYSKVGPAPELPAVPQAPGSAARGGPASAV